MKTLHAHFSYSIPLFFIIFSSFSIYAQKNNKISEAYKTYTKAPREVVYVHLNKSTLIEGEMLGFTAYVFDKFSKNPSKLTKNLYCNIYDKNNNVLKQMLIEVKNGIASNVFNIDSTFKTGQYKFKAYTNWMRNFDEQNHFEAYFSVLDSDESYISKPTINNNVDLQILGEGGKILYNIENTVGIIAKDMYGYGIPNTRGVITNQSGAVVSEFELNKVGLAKALFIPKPGDFYTASIDIKNQTVTKSINDIKLIGVTLQLVPQVENIDLILRTNSQTLKDIKNKKFNVALHNGNVMLLKTITLNKNGIAKLKYPKNILLKGVNIFTVFNDDNKPILERLYFNNTHINHEKPLNTSVTPKKDSLIIRLNLKNKASVKWSNLSVSILPSETKSYNHHNNILSQLYIQPYIKGYLQNGKQYFDSNEKNLDYNFDLLMLTQGWSSYSWDGIFLDKLVLNYGFETGVKVIANKNISKKDKYPLKYMLYTSDETFKPVMFELTEGESQFSFVNVYPNCEDNIYISRVGKDIKPAKLYLQSFPSEIPQLRVNTKTLININKYELESSALTSFKAYNESYETEELGEVTVIGKYTKKQLRTETLQKRAAWSDIYVLDDDDKRSYRNFIDFINAKTTFRARYTNSVGSSIQIYNPRSSITGTGGGVTVFINNVVQTNTSLLAALNMQEVDYIEINRTGLGEGIFGQFGTIRIFTGGEAYSSITDKKQNALVFNPSLTFNKEKRYYTPKYYSHSSEFYKNYGSIDWKPRLSIDKNGYINLIIKNPQVPFSLFIEGTTDSGNLISERKNLSGRIKS